MHTDKIFPVVMLISFTYSGKDSGGETGLSGDGDLVLAAEVAGVGRRGSAEAATLTVAAEAEAAAELMMAEATGTGSQNHV